MRFWRNNRKGAGAKKSAGASLPTVLMASALILTLAFTVVGVSFNHINMSTRLTNVQQARNLAEAVVARGMERVMATDGNYGKNTGETLQITFPDAPDGSLGALSFDAGDAGTLQVLCSTNNLETDTSTTADDGTVIPANAVHLVGVGRCNGVERTVEALLYIPRFPYVIGSSGPIRSNGGLFVAGVKDKSALDAGFPIPEDELIPGDLVTNASSGGDTAVNLTGTNQVKGDLQSSQGATLSNDTVVEGEVRLYADAVEIPDLDINSYDPAGKPGLDDTVSASYDAGNPPPVIDGFFKRIGNLDIYAGSGGLKLEGGLLYVDGNLEVYDGVHGKGAIVVTGTTTIHGGGSASTDNMAAILSGDTVSISGDANGNAMFEGLIYTEGNLDARFMTLAGTFVANNPNPSGDTMTFEDANLIHVPEYGATDGGGGNPDPISLSGLTLAISAGKFSEMGAGSLAPPVSLTPVPDMTHFDDGGSFRANYYNMIPAPTGPGPVGYLDYTNDSLINGQSTADPYTIDADDFSYVIGGNTVSAADAPDALLPGVAAWLVPQLEANGRVWLGDSAYLQPPDPAAGLTITERDYIKVKLASQFSGTDFIEMGLQNDVDGSFHAAFSQFFSTSGGGGGGGGGTASYSIDLSDFFSVADSVRVLYWRERESN